MKVVLDFLAARWRLCPIRKGSAFSVDCAPRRNSNSGQGDRANDSSGFCPPLPRLPSARLFSFLLLWELRSSSATLTFHSLCALVPSRSFRIRDGDFLSERVSGSPHAALLCTPRPPRLKPPSLFVLQSCHVCRL